MIAISLTYRQPLTQDHVTQSTDIGNLTKSFDLMSEIGVGETAQLQKNMNLTLDVTYGHGFLNEGTKDSLSFHNNAWTFSGGVAWAM